MKDGNLLRTSLRSRYAVERELGRGGMATVYLAEDLKHRRKVAIKVLRPELAATLGSERFLREIRIAARLQHPNILPLYDSGTAQGLLYYVMPYVEGESLRYKLDREGQLSVEESLGIAREVADALTCAHAQGVIHRDIKPGNILLSGGHAIVADFGIARAISQAGADRVTETGLAVGTPSYMSPEQASGDSELDARSDIYSLGCLLYEMLAGQPPFTGRSARVIAARQLLADPPSLRVIRPSAPRFVVEIIETALAKSPADRFASASEFSAALEGLVKRKRPRRARRPVPRNWVLRTALIGVPLVVGASVWVILGRGRSPLDANKIVVFPLIDRGAGSGEVERGWDVSIAIGSAVEHTHPLKWLDAWTSLDERVRVNPALLTSEAAARISRDHAARYFLHGVLSDDADSLKVVLRLHDAEGDSLVAQQSASGAQRSSSLPQLAMEALTGLLPRLLDPGRTIDLSSLTDRDPAAIALWLQGEREYRQSRFLTALEFYRRAVDEDSLLAFAAVKGAQAASWKSRFGEAEELIEVALANDSLLPTRYRDLAHGLQAFLAGRADTAVHRLGKAYLADPDWSEAAMALGEVFYHLIPSETSLEFLAQVPFGRPVLDTRLMPAESIAAVWFGEALARDSGFIPPRLHLAEIALRDGKVDRARTLIRRVELADPDSAFLQPLMLMLNCVEQGIDRFRWVEAAGGNVRAMLLAARALAPGAGQLLCAKEGFRAVLGSGAASDEERWGALVGIQGLLVAEGRYAEALALLDSAVAAGTIGAMSLYVFDALAGAPMEAKGAEAELFARRVAGEDYTAAGPQTRWLLGIWNARHGNLDKADRLMVGLEVEASKSGRRQDRLLSDALAAHVALARGDTTMAIDRLRSLKATAPRFLLTWDPAFPLPLERIQLAELLLARGEYEDAYRVATLLDHPEPVMFLPLIPKSLRIRLDAAEALGRPQLADRYRDRLEVLGRNDVIAANR